VLGQSIDNGVEMVKRTMKTNVTTLTLARFVQANTLPDEPFLYIGNFASINLLSERLPAGYYPYYPGAFPPAITDKYAEELITIKPQLIGYGNWKLPDALMEFIDDNYTVVYEENIHKLCRLNTPSE
jgi:hypothetical protein